MWRGRLSNTLWMPELNPSSVNVEHRQQLARSFACVEEHTSEKKRKIITVNFSKVKRKSDDEKNETTPIFLVTAVAKASAIQKPESAIERAQEKRHEKDQIIIPEGGKLDYLEKPA